MESSEKNKQMSKPRGREIRNRLTGARGAGEGDKGRKKGKGLVKEQV